MPAKETQTVAARIPNDIAEQVNLIVRVSGVSLSKVVGQLIADGLLYARDARKSGAKDEISPMLAEDIEETETK